MPQQELLEIYKLHAELADRVSQRREGANRIFVGLLTGLLIFLVAFLRYGANILSENLVIIAVGILGVALSVSWYVVIRSYRQLNDGKFKALHELEEQLAYPFFKREWELLGEGRSIKRYWKLTVVETSLPIIFSILFLVLIFVVVLSCFPSI